MALNIRRIAGLSLIAAIACAKGVQTPTASIAPGAAASGVIIGQVVRLDGTSSADPQGRELTYAWSFASLPQGSAATLNDPKTATPSFAVDAPGDYVVQLTVSNAFLTSPAVTQKITASACGGQAPAISNLTARSAGNSDSIGVGTLVGLSVQVTSPDNDPATCKLNETFSYAWRMIAQPASSTATLNNPAAVAPSFQPDVAGTYTLRLVATASNGRSSAPSDLSITVSNCGSNNPSVVSVTPSLQAGKVYSVGTSVQLTAQPDDADNSAACHNLGQTFTYQWSIAQLPTGSHASLNSATAVNPTFTPDVAGDYTVRLIITDSTGRQSQPKDTVITIPTCGNNAPSAVVNVAPTSYIGGLVQLGATVTDLDNIATGACGVSLNQTFTLAWSILALPAGSNAQLNNPTGTNPSFTPDVAGNYTLQVIATDSTGLKSAPAFATVSVKGCGNAAPVVDSLTGPSSAFNAGSVVTISSQVHDPDNLAAPAGCGLNQSLTYAWAVTSRPLKSNAFVVTPSAASAVFTADVVGSYQLRLVVTDSTGMASAPAFINLATSACGTAAPTITSATVSNTSPNPGVLVALNATAHDLDNDAACNLQQALSYTWSVVSRPATSGAALSNPGVPNPTFTPDAIGTYQFSVAVTDSTGLSSAPTYLSLTTTTCGSAVPTVAASADDTLVDPGTVVHLAAVASSTDNLCLIGSTETFTYQWKQISRPAGSSAVLSDPTAASPTFAPDVYGSYQFQVTATASNGLSSAPAFVNVGADNCALLPPAVKGGIAVNGGTVIGTPANLSAFALSPEPNCRADGNHIFTWQITGKPLGSQALLVAPVTTNGQAQFTPDVPGSYQVQLVISNSLGYQSQPVYTTINTASCGTAALQFAAAPGDITSTEFYPANSTTISPTRDVGVRMQLAAHFTDPNTCGSIPVAPFTYRWALISTPTGSRAQLTSTTDATPSFVPDVPGTYQVAATITDAVGMSTPTNVETFTTTNCGANIPVAAIAPSTAQSVNSYALNPLTGSATTADNTSCPSRFAVPSFTYAWSISSSPAGGRATLSSLADKNTTFEAFAAGSYEVSLVATGSNGLVSAPVTLPFTVSACGSHAPAIVGVTTQVGGVAVSRPSVGSVVNLTVNATDADSTCGDKVVSYAFNIVSLPSGSAVTTSGTSPTGVFNFTPDVAGSYVFSIVATDSNGLSSAPVQVSVSTAACGPIVAGIQPKAGETTTPLIGSQLDLQITPNAQGVAVVDSCVTSASFTYAWSLTAKPASSQTALTSIASATSAFIPDVPGTYQVQLVVTDNAGLSSAPATLTVNAATCGTAAPSIGAILAAPPTPNAGDLVTVSAPNLTDPNTNCTVSQVTPYQYRWSLISTPSGSRAQLSSQTAATPSFVPDVPNGSYQLALTVTDALGNVSAPQFITVKSTGCGANVPAVSIAETAPAVVAAPPFASNANTDLAMKASVTDADATSCPAQFTPAIAYNWSVQTAPVNAQFAFSGTTAATTTFRAATPGQYTLVARATSSNGPAGTQTAIVNVASCGSNAPTITGVATTDTVKGTAVSRPAVGTTVTLAASTFDADTTAGQCGTSPILTAPTFTWSIVSAPAGSTVIIPQASTTSTLNITPNVAGTYVLSVVATDAQGLSSAPVQVVVATGSCGPVAAGGITATSATPNVGDTVSLAAGAVSDSCVANPGTPAYAWSIVSRPANSSAAITAPSAAAPTFVIDQAGNYTVQLVLTDNGGFSTVYTTGITAGGCTSAPTIVGFTSGGVAPAALFNANDPVTGAAESPVTAIYAGDRVQLHMPISNTAGIKAGSCGAATSTTFQYEWSLVSKPAGSTAQLSSAFDAAPVFTADVPNGVYQFMLVVKDQLGNTSQPFFQLLPTLSNCGARKPTSSFTITNSAPNANQTTVLTSAPVTDPATIAPACPARFDNTAGTYAYAWSVVSQPAGAKAQLSSTSGQSVTFSANQGGAYQVALTTTNFDGNSTTSAPVTINVSNCGAYPPSIASVAAAQNIAGSPLVTPAALYVGFPATLSASVSDPNGTGQCTAPVPGQNFSWTLTGLPAGSHAVLLNANTATPTFTPDVASGTYTIQVAVSNSLGYTQTTTLQVTTDKSCGSNFPVATTLKATQNFPNGTPASINVSSGAGSQPNMDVGYAVGVSATVVDADAACSPAIPANYTYAWKFTSLPPGSAAALTGPATATPSFVPDVVGTYGLQVVTTDAQGKSGTSPVLTLTTSCGAAAPGIAKAADGVTPLLNLEQDVANVTQASGPATLTIRRSTDATSGFNVNRGVAFYPGTPVSLATSVVDADTANGCNLSRTFSYAWSLAAQPAGSNAVVNNPAAAGPSFTPDLPGEYDVQVVVTDNNGKSSGPVVFKLASDGGTAVMAGNCGLQAPVAKIDVPGPVAFVAGASDVYETASRHVQLSAASSSTPDAKPFPSGCGLNLPLSYQWSVLSVPNGSPVGTLDSGSTGQQSLLTINDSSHPGNYVVALDVTAAKKTTRAQVTIHASDNSPTAVVGGGLAAADRSAIAVDPTTGNQVIAWFDSSGSQTVLKFARCTGNCSAGAVQQFSAPVVLDSLGASPFPAAQFDEPRNLDVKVANDGTAYVAWGTTATSTVKACAVNIAAISAAGSPIYSTPIQSGSGCDTQWSPSANWAGKYVSLALRFGTFPGVVYQVNDTTKSAQSPYYVECTANCTVAGTAAYSVPAATYAAANGDQTGRWGSLTYDGGTGTARVAYYVDTIGTPATTKALGYQECPASCGGTPSWSAPTVVASVTSTPGGDVGRYASLAIAPPNTLGNSSPTNSAPRIAYIDHTGGSQGVVKLASCAASCTSAANWSSAIVDGNPDVETGTQLAMSNNGLPRISYIDQAGTNQQLKVASAQALNGPFSLMTVYPVDTSASSAAMALTPNGALRFSYTSNSALNSIAVGQ